MKATTKAKRGKPASKKRRQASIPTRPRITEKAPRAKPSPAAALPELVPSAKEATDGVDCPTCKARRGERCKSAKGGYLRDLDMLVHPKRWRAFERAQEAEAKSAPVATSIVCLECEHASCPITPSCAACPACAHQAATGKGATKVSEWRKPCAACGAKSGHPCLTPAKTSYAGGLTHRIRGGTLDNEQPSAPTPAAPSARVPSTINLMIAEVRRDGGTQPRAAIDPQTVEEYAEAYARGDQLPDPLVFYDGSQYWLADGFHRVAALQSNGCTAAVFWLRQGTQRDAVLYSCGANARHGLRRSNADKRRAVEVLVRDEEWGKKSDRWIAEQCAVDHKTVGRWRAELGGSSAGEVPHLTTREGQDGKSYPASQPSRAPAATPEARTLPLFDQPEYQPAPPPPPAPRADRAPVAGEEIEGNFAGAWKLVRVHRVDHQIIVALAYGRPIEWALADFGTAWRWPQRGFEGVDPAAGADPAGKSSVSSEIGSRTVPSLEHTSPEQTAPVAQVLHDASPLEDRPLKRRWRSMLGLPELGKLSPAAVIDAYRARMRLSLDEFEALKLTPEDLREAKAHGLSQWFTRPALADKMVSISGLLLMAKPSRPKPLRILEPSAGAGALLAACARVAKGSIYTTAYEIDPDLVALLGKQDVNEVLGIDFLGADAPTERFDLGIANTPSERGLDGLFLERMMAWCSRVVVLLRTNALHGQERAERCWSRVERGEWQLADLVYCVERERFEGPGDDSALSDYTIVHLVRTPSGRGQRALTHVSWWTTDAVAGESSSEAAE